MFTNNEPDFGLAFPEDEFDVDHSQLGELQ